MNEELLIKYLLEETSAEERVQVTHWLGESDENQKEFNRFKQIWDSSKVLSADKKQDPEKAWEKFKTLRDLQDEKKVKSIRRPYTWLKVAAAMLMALTATWFYMDQQKAYNVLSAVQEVSKETLPDGSKLVLNKNTTINYADFKGSKRTISLEKGEVFCDVVPDKSRPFTIRANDVSITVLGTSFNVKHNEHFTEVIVKTGRVSVSRNGRAILLAPGEKVRIPANSSQWDKTVNQDQLHLYYLDNKTFIANNIPLWRMVEVLNEAYNSEIEIEGKRLKTATLNATFKDESLDDILTVIEETFHARVIKKEGKIILKDK